MAERIVREEVTRSMRRENRKDPPGWMGLAV